MSSDASPTPGQSDVPVAPARIPRAITFSLLTLILLIGASARLIALSSQPYETDEYWHAELSTARGSLERHLPHNQILHFDHKVTSLAGAQPWWAIWREMGDTVHPPLYVIALRFWRATFGEGKFASRSLGALASVISIALLFELARRLHGTSVGLWSAAIFALASPQIELARSLRGYTFELMWILCCALLVIAIAQRPSRSWWMIVALVLSTMCALLSHYFAAFALAAIGLYALVGLRGRARVEAVGALLLGAIGFFAAWWPQLHEQMQHLPAATESWISDAYPGHAGRALSSFASIPLRMLFEPRHEVEWVGIGSVVLFVLPLLFLRRQRELLLWVVWLWLATTPLLAIDLLRATKHLAYVRYILLAGPPVYVLSSALLARRPGAWARNALPIVVTLGCALSIGSAYDAPRGDYRAMAQFIDEHRAGDEPVILAITQKGWVPPITFLALIDESRTFPWPLILADEAPLNEKLLAEVRRAGGAILVRDSDAQPIESILPGARADALTFIPWAGMIWHVKFSRDANSGLPSTLPLRRQR